LSDPADRSVTDDAFLGGALRILQPKDGYRAGVDAVLLAASASVRAGRRERVLDVGAGVGVVGLALARRIADAEVVLVERDARLAPISSATACRHACA
jgi:tRNA1(Val) A37 N6-methylase TrmN6